MKRYMTFVLSMAAMVALARPVDVHRARALVEAHFFAPAVCVSPVDWEELYVFAPAEGQGFVIVAADDCVQPVLAYSAAGQFPVEQMPEHVKAWIDGYRHEISAFVKDAAYPGEDNYALWQNPKGRKSGQAGPLLSTTWNQSPYYNELCPFDGIYFRRAVTGCVATAMAQVMKYWSFPPVGWGSHSYNHNYYGILEAQFDTTHYAWNLMPDSLNASSDSAEIMAVAQLMYHVGVAVEMGYGTTGSGADVICYDSCFAPSAETALKTYFRYNPRLRAVYKDEFSDREWDSLIRAEIDLGQPVLHSGGHAFVVDGYDSTGLFHVNWGWGGRYDGYYALNHLVPYAGMDFSSDSRALIGIRPASLSADSVATVNVVSADTNQGTVSGSGLYAVLRDTVVLAVQARDGYVLDHWASGGNNTPVAFIASDNHTDTAYFRPISQDTVGYCNSNCIKVGYDANEWGIRVPASVRRSQCSLTAVQVYHYTDYEPVTLSVYVGPMPTEANLVYTTQLETHPRGWTTYALNSALSVDDTSTIWITLQGGLIETAMSRYLGNPNGSWLRMPDGWVTCGEKINGAWMIRAIFTENPHQNGISPNAADLSLSAVKHRLVNRTLSIDNPARLAVALYDLSGRQIFLSDDNASTVQLRSSGVYVLKVEGESPRKLIVVR